MSSYTYAETFTRTHAKRLAARVTTDLRQCHMLYPDPSESMLEQYRAELEELIAGNYVAQYQFGYKREGRAVWSLRYIVGPDGDLVSSGPAGGVPAGIDVNGATFFNLLTFSYHWAALDSADKQKVENLLPFIRRWDSLPDDALGTWTRDRVYAAGGVLLDRSIFRSWL